jgi:hypothetical protein
MYRRDTPKSHSLTRPDLRFGGSNESKLPFTSKEIVYSINIKSKLEKNFENIPFSPASIRMTSTPTSEFRNALPTKTAQLKFYQAFNHFNVLEKKKFINLIELT